MKYRTAVKTGRTAAMQVEALRAGSFVRYTAMVERLSSGYVRPLELRFPVSRPASSRLHALAAWLLVVVLLAVGGLAAERALAQDKAPVTDSAITQRVQSALARDRRLGEMHIEVRTHEGTVNLTGFVRTLEDIARAGALAGAVRGVVGVTNGLRVANRPSRA